MGKARVAPINVVTIPRLKLTAATVSAARTLSQWYSRRQKAWERAVLQQDVVGTRIPDSVRRSTSACDLPSTWTGTLARCRGLRVLKTLRATLPAVLGLLV
ncbi:hypothetical protein COCON_G00060790 [Conger conger]|uniref:Uncharacterized protein n=1 Tax=Conger conger TaxID=82655 RepID=A0A9Q1DRA3_CONCO|nr:hypothetical protein COCON_G00060790 [Conger conger]